MSQVSNFLDRFSNDRDFSIPLPFQWTVTLTEGGIIGAISTALNKINQRWTVTGSSHWSSGDNILVAQEITLPTEAFEATIIGQENRGGFMPGYGVTQRTDFLSRSLVINFIETERDIEAELFRPWIIALGVDGLLNTSLKAPAIDVTQYTRDMKPRKKYKFTDVFPTNCEGYTINYGDQEFIVKSVTFGYQNYTLEIPNK